MGRSYQDQGKGEDKDLIIRSRSGPQIRIWIRINSWMRIMTSDPDWDQDKDLTLGERSEPKIRISIRVRIMISTEHH